jgi:hypothetical protein
MGANDQLLGFFPANLNVDSPLLREIARKRYPTYFK